MRFSKWHALGNAYLLVEQAELTPERVRELVGDADGVVEILSARDNEADVRIWNADGSTAEMSGNATRIAARWLADRTGAGEVVIRVGKRDVVARVLASGDIEQDVGEFHVGAPEVLDDVRFVPVTVGNPHAVVDGDPEEIRRIGPLLETHPRFPERTNVQVARLERDGVVTARVWERGVGETASSGTSAVAVAAALVGAGDVAVDFPGGRLHVRLESGRALVRGPAARVTT